MLKVLVTGAGAVLGQGIIKALKDTRLEISIVACDPDPRAVGLYWADAARLIPMVADANYVEELAALLDRERPDVVLVGTDVELPVFARHRHDWEARFATHILVSDERVVQVADDKYLTAQFLKQHGLAYPQSALPEERESLDSLIRSVGFPLIVKPRIGARSCGVALVEDAGQLENAIEGRAGLVVQQWAGHSDQEFTSGVLFFDGDVQAAITMRRDLRDGNTHRAYVDAFPQVESYVRDLGRALRPHGPANFQFRVDEQGQPRLFEINARFSGTTPMRAKCGFNEVEMCIRKLVYGTPVEQPPIAHGLFLRYLDEIFVTAEQLARKV